MPGCHSVFLPLMRAWRLEHGRYEVRLGADADGDGQAAGGPDGGQRPDMGAAADALGVSEQALMDALGDPPPDFEATAKSLGLTVEALQEALGGDQAGPPPADQ